MMPHSQPLEILNQQARRDGFKIEDVNWSQPIDVTKKWMPEGLVNIRFLPAYANWDARLRLRYNHLYALAIAEQFIWFEQGIVIPIMQRILKRHDLDLDLREALEHFVTDELKHSELFHRLIRHADPGLRAGYQFYNLNFAQAAFYRLIVDNPDFFIAWIWMTIYFEERTMHISRLYHTERNSIDSIFARCHHLHMLDEARHLQIDQYLLHSLYDHQPRWKKLMAAKMYRKVLEAYASPGRIARKILAGMQNEFPQSKLELMQVQLELPTLAKNRDFITTMFGDHAIGRTRVLLQEYPEMRRALEVIS